MKATLVTFFQRARKHIAWRLFVGVMACIGGITTLASLYNDVIMPMCCPSREVSHKVELEDLLRLFTPNTNDSGLEWTTGTAPDSPIIWETDERYGNVPDEDFFHMFSAARHGKTTVTIRGKPAHEQFDKTVHPAVWDVSMYGYMAGVECIQFSSAGSGYNEMPKVMDALSQYAELKDKHPESAFTFIGKLYKLSLPGKQPSWLVESWSIGNHSWFVDLTLFPGESSYSLAKECLEKLL